MRYYLVAKEAKLNELKPLIYYHPYNSSKLSMQEREEVD